MGRPVTVNVGPLTGTDADGIGLSQAAAAAQQLAINGTLSTGFDADNIALAQNPGGAGALTLNGALVVGGIAQLGAMRYIVFTCAADETDVTFTVTGIGMNAAGTYSVVDSFVGANAGVRVSNKQFYQILSITTSGAGSGNISVGTNGTYTADKPRRITATSGGDDTGITFTITGTDVTGHKQVEVLTGVSGSAAQSALDFATVTSVLTSGAVASTIQIGINGVASSPWVRFDDDADTGEISIQVTVDGTVNYTIQQTMQDPNSVSDPVLPYEVTWVNHPDSNVVGATTTQQSNYAYPPTFARVVLNSGSGSISAVFRQMGQMG